jgi:hypothetical protein
MDFVGYMMHEPQGLCKKFLQNSSTSTDRVMMLMHDEDAASSDDQGLGKSVGNKNTLKVLKAITHNL